MRKKAAARTVNEFFVYRADRKDEFRILSPERPEGDCEDYALTVLDYISNHKFKKLKRRLRKGKAELVFCIDPYKQKHNILKYGKKYIDNQLKRWVTRDELSALGYRNLKTQPWRWVLGKLRRGAA